MGITRQHNFGHDNKAYLFLSYNELTSADTKKHKEVEMAQTTKNASSCCAASANLVHMLHRTTSNTTKFMLHRATPQVIYPLNFH